MLLYGNILSTAESLSRLRSVSGKTGQARDSKAGAFSGCDNDSAADDPRIGRATTWQGDLKPRRIDGRRESTRRVCLNSGARAIRTSQALLHMPGRISGSSVLSQKLRTRQIAPGGRSSSSPKVDRSMGTEAKPNFCSLSYFSLTLCCVAPCSRWHGGHATLHSAAAGHAASATERPAGFRRERTSSCRLRPATRQFLSHLPNVGRALKLYPLCNGITNLGRVFVQGQIGPIDCKEEIGRKSFDSVRTCGSEGCEKRLRREGRDNTRPSHLLTIRLRPVFP
jgi:hypothetical protein